MQLSNDFNIITVKKEGTFEILKQSKEAEEKYGKNEVTTAIIGTIFDEDDNFYILKTVEENYKKLGDNEIFNYSPSISGTEEFKNCIKKYIFGEQLYNFTNSYIGVTATTGGTGAIYNSFRMYTNIDEIVLLPNYKWEAYTQIAMGNQLKYDIYNLFKNDKFNLENFKKKVIDLVKKQGKALILINDPCHNPSGYSLALEEWQNIIEILKDASKYGQIVLLNDIAYLDYDNRGYEKVREYLKYFSNLPENIIILIAFSMSKSFTSYGLRVGAQIAISSSKKVIESFDNYSNYMCRATWSNISRGGMELFTKIVNDNNELKKLIKEREKIINLLQNRSNIFLEKARTVNLRVLPYKSGFFITIPLENSIINNIIEDLKQQKVFVLPIDEGIRIAICSINIEKLKLLPKIIAKSIEKFIKK